MAGKELGRLITAMVTPFASDGAVNYDQLGKLAGQLIQGGSDALLVTGTTGESPTLSHEEKLECYRTVMAAADGRAPVIAGTGNYNTAESVRSRARRKRSAWTACCSWCPTTTTRPKRASTSTSRPSRIAPRCRVSSTTCPPARCATWKPRPPPASPRWITSSAVKEASGDLGQISDVLRLTPDDFRVWSGNDSDTYHIMCMGGYGIISVASHVIGLQIKKMINATLASDIPAAGALHQQLMPLFTSIFPPISPVASPAAIKACLNVSGFDAGGHRLPLIPSPMRSRIPSGNCWALRVGPESFGHGNGVVGKHSQGH